MNRKNMTVRLFAFLLCALFMLPLFTVNVTGITAETPKKIMRVGWFNQPGYQELDQKGKPSGYNYEYLMRIAQNTDWEYEFVEGASFAACYEMLEAGDIDILGYLLRTEPREQEIAYPSLSCGSVSTSLFVKKDNPISQYDFESFDGINVACMKSQNAVYLLEYAKEKNFSVNLTYYENIQAVMDAVSSGDADAGINSAHHEQENTKIVASFAPNPFYFGVKKGDSESLLQLNNALTAINLESPFYDRDLAYKYLPQLRDSLNLTKAEREYLSKNSELEISFYPNWFPISILDQDTGEFSGIAYDVFERISQLTDMQFTYVPVVRGSEEAKNADVIAAIVYNLSDAYEMNVRLTNQYLNIPLAVVRNSGMGVEQIKSTAVSSHFLDSVECKTIEGTQILSYNTVQQALEQVASGGADQALINAFASEHFLNQAKYRNLQSTILYSEGYDICVAISNTIPVELCSIFNKAFEMISVADMNAILSKNTTRSLAINIDNIISQMPADVILVAAITLFIMIALMLYIIIRQRSYSQKVKKILYTDELTGGLSFKGFVAKAEHHLSKTNEKKAFIIDFDINHFGEYNNINGYAQGNQLLKDIVNVSQRACISGEFFARIQADHFVAFAFGENVGAIIDIIARAQNYFAEVKGSGSLLLSYGIYEIVDKQMSIADMCDRALAAKNTIKGNYDRFIAVYDEDLHKKEIGEVEILDRFDKALQEDEFVHYFQPKYDSKTRQIVGAEALVRWIRKDGKIVMPGDFIELLEVNGLITKLDFHMLEKLCKSMAQRIGKGEKPLPIAINFSRVHLYDPRFAQHLTEITQQYKISPSLLEIEITETAFVENQQEIIKMVDLLHEAGFMVSMDDFGSGFSSLNILKDINFDVIKIDRAFLSSIGGSKKSETVISSIVSLAGQLSLKTVAEGVETEQQYELLKNCGCDMVQGYYFARPMPEEDYLELEK